MPTLTSVAESIASMTRKYWPKAYGRENIPLEPRKPDPYLYCFFIIDGSPASPVMLLGPVQGDSVDHTLFWMPTEKDDCVW